MRCPGHVSTQHALVRHCVECGGEIDRRSKSTGLLSWSVAHHPATLTSYLGLICVVSTEGSLLCFNSDLQPLTAYGVSITGETPNLCVTDGNLYISTLFGVQSIDLVDLLQSEGLENRQGNVAPRTGKEVLETRKVTLTEQPALSPMSTVGNSIYGVVTGNGLC